MPGPQPEAGRRPLKEMKNRGCPISRVFFAREVGIFDRACRRGASPGKSHKMTGQPRRGEGDLVRPAFNLKSLASRGKCTIFTVQQQSTTRIVTFGRSQEFYETRPPRGFCAKTILRFAQFPVRGLCTACTRLKTRVVTNAYFRLTKKIEGVQQDRSLTAS
jgi:hypothetical protein